MLEPCDVLFLALPHGESQKHIDHYAALAPKLLILPLIFASAMQLFIKNITTKTTTPQPGWSALFMGCPSCTARKCAAASYISGVGCNATAANLALLAPLKAGLLDLEKPIIVDIKVVRLKPGKPQTRLASP